MSYGHRCAAALSLSAVASQLVCITTALPAALLVSASATATADQRHRAERKRSWLVQPSGDSTSRRSRTHADDGSESSAGRHMRREPSTGEHHGQHQRAGDANRYIESSAEDGHWTGNRLAHRQPEFGKAVPGEVIENLFEPVQQKVYGSTPEGIVQLGTPPKEMLVVFDTGSDKFIAKTWETISAELQKVDKGLQGFIEPTSRLYSSDASTTFSQVYVLANDTALAKTGYIAYGSGAVTTDEGVDTVRVVGQDVEDFPVSQIVKDSLDLLHTEEAIYGVLGLMHKKNATGSETLFTRLRNTGRMTSMGYCRDAANDNGTFIWGDRDTSGYRIEVIGQKHWAVELTNVVAVPHIAEVTTTSAPPDSAGTVSSDPDFTVLKKKQSQSSHGPYFEADPRSSPDASDTGSTPDLSDSGEAAGTLDAFNACPNKQDCVVIVDTGSNILACPSATYDKLLASLAIARDCSNFDKLPDISLTLGTFNITVPPTSYVMKMSLPAWAKYNDDPDASSDDSDRQPSIDSFTGDSRQEAWGSGKGSLGKSTSTTLQGGSMLGQSRREAVLTPWEKTFKHLNRKHGFDLRVALRGASVRSINASEYICMPAIFPLDSMTTQGALWVVGTPLFDAYYARWSWPLKAEQPEVHLQSIHEAAACEETLAAGAPVSADSSAPLAGQEQPQAGSLAARSPAQKVSRSRGPNVRDPEQIRFPYWAVDLAEV